MTRRYGVIFKIMQLTVTPPCTGCNWKRTATKRQFFSEISFWIVHDKIFCDCLQRDCRIEQLSVVSTARLMQMQLVYFVAIVLFEVCH